MSLRKIFLFIFSIATICNLQADGIRFSSDLLSHTVEVLECEQQLDTLPEGSRIIALPSGMSVRVCKRGDRVIHLGSPLFPDLLYTDQPLIYDYLEFAMLDHYCHIADNPFLFKNLRFLEGDWTMMEQVTTETPCTVNSLEGIWYEVSWTLTDGKRVRIDVPVEYDRLAMMSRQELELMFMEDLAAGNTAVRPTSTLPDQLYATPDVNIFLQKGNHFILPAINQNSYFLLEEDSYTLVCDPAYPTQTMANLINADCDDMPMIQLDLTMQLYNHQSVSHRVYLSDLLAYARTRGCVPYWGLESLEGETLKGSLYLVNTATSYCHIVRIKAETGNLFNTNEAISGKITAFVPIGSIKNLYEEKDLKYIFDQQTK